MDLQLYRRTFLAGFFITIRFLFCPKLSGVFCRDAVDQAGFAQPPAQSWSKGYGTGAQLRSQQWLYGNLSRNPTPRIDTVTANWLGTIGPLRNSR